VGQNLLILRGVMKGVALPSPSQDGEPLRRAIDIAVRLLFHFACIAALCWPALLNRQPFYFPDTTSYVRAADSAVYLFSGKTVTTVWSDRYRHSLPQRSVAASAPAPVGLGANGNDISHGSVMAGRSPYFGMLLWLSYVLSSFWLFVLVQAAVAYALIRIGLRLFGVVARPAVAAVIGGLSLLSTLPLVVGLLLPDLLAALGLLAMLILLIDRGRLSRGERLLVVATMLASVVSHLTHIFILLAVALAGFALAMLHRQRFARLIRPSLAGLIVVAIGMASVLVTDIVVQQQFGKKPLLVPLLTARFIADGPGARFIAEHCPQSGFAICAYKGRPPVDATSFLWSRDPRVGVFLIADPVTRERISEQDKAFGLAVLGAYPLDQSAAILRNGASQIARFEVDLLNANCFRRFDCWAALPDREYRRMQASMGGRGLWPQKAMTIIYYATVFAAIAAIGLWATTRRRWSDRDHDLALWIGLLATAMIVNALLGGGISEPQSRYQARLIWLLPFFGAIALLAWRTRQDDSAVRRS
jgi:hypothetical protein